MKRTGLGAWLFIVFVLGLNACSNNSVKDLRDKNASDASLSQSQDSSSQNTYKVPTQYGTFIKPGELEPAVDFWRKTYSLWHRSEVAVHDDRYMDVIYEVFVLPGDVAESLTSEQKNIVSQRREFWKAQLSVLEAKVRNNEPLNTNERQIVAKLTHNGRQINHVVAGASERIRSQRGTLERFKKGLDISQRYDRQFRKIFKEAGLPEDLAFLPHVESSFQFTAKSSAGAVGMWQFTKSGAQTFMPDNNKIDQRLDPVASAIGAANYLKHAYKKLGDWPAAITSYNHGIGGMKRAQNQVGRDFVQIVDTYTGSAFGFASRNYYAQFLAAREIASNPRQYFP